MDIILKEINTDYDQSKNIIESALYDEESILLEQPKLVEEFQH